MRLPVYLDHAATTPVATEVLHAMLPYYQEQPWNASAMYTGGRQAREAVEKARAQVATLIGARPEEIHFTSGGTEADNWALKAVPVVRTGVRPQGLVSAIEHHAVLEAADSLRRQGWEILHIPVSEAGIVEPYDVEKRISERTAFVSVMLANNEVGTIQPIREIGSVCRRRGVLFHVDAVQALGLLAIDVNDLGADLMSFSSHKIYGPKGVGALYVRQGVPLGRWMDGGSQEAGMRAGTINVPGVVGFGAACELVGRHRPADAARALELRDRLLRGILEQVPEVLVTADEAKRLPSSAHICVRGVEGEAVLTGLDAAGVYASAGAACAAGSVETSHVLRAMGLADEWARGAVRMTLGRENTEDQIDYTVAVLAEVVKELRG